MVYFDSDTLFLYFRKIGFWIENKSPESSELNHNWKMIYSGKNDKKSRIHFILCKLDKFVLFIPQQ